MSEGELVDDGGNYDDDRWEESRNVKSSSDELSDFLPSAVKQKQPLDNCQPARFNVFIKTGMDGLIK